MGTSLPPIIGKIPQMRMDAMMRLWRNAVEIRSNEGKKSQWRAAGQVLDAINKEWSRRRRQPPNLEEFFKWPSTEAEPGRRSKIDVEDWFQEGVLSYMGYQVGSTNGVASNLRRRILEQIFEGSLPPIFPPSYLNQWGEPKSAARLQKMAEAIAAFSRNAKRRRSGSLWGAIRDWRAIWNSSMSNTISAISTFLGPRRHWSASIGLRIASTFTASLTA